MVQDNQLLKSQVKAFWEAETCDTRYGLSADRKQYFDEIERTRYALEPYIPGFAGFAGRRGLVELPPVPASTLIWRAANFTDKPMMWICSS